MTEAAGRQHESSMESGSRETGRDPQEGNRQSNKPMDEKGLFMDIERFTQISSDLKNCLSDIVGRIKNAMDGLGSLQKEVEQKKSELKQARDIEVSAVALENLVEEQRMKKVEFERFMENQRRCWEEEKASKEREDTEYRESLERRRQKEEEDYKRKWTEEQSIIRKKFEEEFAAVREQYSEKQKAIEMNLEERARALKERELESVRLIQELDLLMTRLMERTRKGSEGVCTPDRECIKNPGTVDQTLDSSETRPSKKVPEERKSAEGTEQLNKDKDPNDASVRETLISLDRRI